MGRMFELFTRPAGQDAPVTAGPNAPEGLVHSAETRQGNLESRLDVPDEDTTPFFEVGEGVDEADPTVPLRVTSPSASLPKLHSQSDASPPVLFAIRFEPIEAPDTLRFTPPYSFGSAVIAFHDPRHLIAQQYRGLMSQVMDQVQECATPVLAFTGPDPLQRAAVALNLAVTLARNGQVRVLAVDGSREGVFPAQAGVVPAPGVAVGTELDRLGVMTLGDPSVRANSPGWLDALRSEYDWIILDLAPEMLQREEFRPPISVPHRQQTTTPLDAVYLVTEEAEANGEAIRQLLSGLQQQSLPVLGMVWTKYLDSSAEQDSP